MSPTANRSTRPHSRSAEPEYLGDRLHRRVVLDRDRLLALLQEGRWSQRLLAAEMGQLRPGTRVAPSTIHRILLGNRAPKLSTIVRLAEALDCDVADLVLGYCDDSARTSPWYADPHFIARHAHFLATLGHSLGSLLANVHVDGRVLPRAAHRESIAVPMGCDFVDVSLYPAPTFNTQSWLVSLRLDTPANPILVDYASLEREGRRVAVRSVWGGTERAARLPAVGSPIELRLHVAPSTRRLFIRSNAPFRSSNAPTVQISRPKRLDIDALAGPFAQSRLGPLPASPHKAPRGNAE